MTEEPLDLSDDQVAYYRRVIKTHALDPATGLCGICGVLRCPDWVDAYDKLAAAHKTMTEQRVWEPYQARRQP